MLSKSDEKKIAGFKKILDRGDKITLGECTRFMDTYTLNEDIPSGKAQINAGLNSLSKQEYLEISHVIGGGVLKLLEEITQT